jgi:hypothetical protein
MKRRDVLRHLEQNVASFCVKALGIRFIGIQQ